MTIVEPELTLEKTGPPQLQRGIPAVYTLNVHNVGDSPAYNVTLYDLLPNQADGGTCDAAPDTVHGTGVRVQRHHGCLRCYSLQGTDYTVAFQGDPDCTVTFNFLTPESAPAADERLIVTYQAYLDLDSLEGIDLTDIAGATEWFSIDVSDATALNYARTYERTVTDGTVGTLDHEDAHTAVTFTPTLAFEKYAVNVTSGEDPATVATPGDTIRYTLTLENLADTPLDGFQVIDELDRLNATPMWQAGIAHNYQPAARRYR